MEYACLFYVPEDASPGPEVYAECIAVAEEAHRAGAMVDARGLEDASSATTVRIRDGKRLLTDGPFAETKEQLGGYYLIDVPNLDDAIRWAAKIPSATHGSIEIRPQTANQALLHV